MARSKVAKRTIEHDIFNMPVRKPSKAESRAKGAANEYACAKSVGLWAGTKFTRTPASGGLGWKRHRGVAADLVCEDEDFNFPFSVETKHLARLDGWRVVDVWKQVLRDAIRAQRLPMALLRKDRMPTFRIERYSFVTYHDYFLILDARWGGMLVAMKVKPEYEFTGPFDEDLMAFKFSTVYFTLPYEQLLKSIEYGNYLQKFCAEHDPEDPELRKMLSMDAFKKKKNVETDAGDFTEDSPDSDED